MSSTDQRVPPEETVLDEGRDQGHGQGHDDAADPGRRRGAGRAPFAGGHLAGLAGQDLLARGMWAEGLVAALATLAVAWPLTDLLREETWLAPAVIMVALVALVGAVLRTVDAPPSLVSLGQLLLGLVGVSQFYLRDTLRWGFVPTGFTAERVGDLLRESGTVLQTYAAPAPTTTGVAFLIVSVLTLTAVSVDSMGVTGRAPASAGIPLAAGFLVSVSNSGQAMQPWYFAAVAILWLVMLAQQGHRVLAGWPSTDRREAVGSQDVSSGVPTYRGLTQVLGALTLLTAIIGAAVIPHLPPTFFADGLARNTQARTVGDGAAEVSFTETMDPSKDLQNRSQAPVLTYRTNAIRLEPLRVTATEQWTDGRWVAPERDPAELLPAGAPLPRPEGMGKDVPAEEQRITVTGNGLQVPHLALPFPPASLTLDGGEAAYRFDPSDSTVLLQQAAQGYTATYLSLAARSELPAGVGDTPADPELFDEMLLTVDPASAEEVAALAEEVVGGTTNSLEAAVRIQDHLRGSAYTYSLTLDPPAAAGADDPIGGFLQTRRGYCVQFATAMVMMARSEGIPARMAVGFLPGQIQTDGTRKVIASDAHTWPELWIDGLGWTRFEPTPGVRSSAPPAYARQESDASATQTTTTTTTRSLAPTQNPTAAPQDKGLWQQLWPVLWRTGLVVLALALLMALVPVVGRRYREAGLRSATTAGERVEGHWLLLTRSLRDLGVSPPPARSPRGMRRHYREATSLNRQGEDALGRITTTLERTRYADPGSLEDAAAQRMGEDVRTVVEQVRMATPWNIRANATVLPQSGLTGIRAWWRGVRR